MTRPLADIRAELTRRALERRQAWAETNLIGEGVLTQRIETLLDEMAAHPDFVKVPC
jgi:hypothetical protein